jgi:hypothetical protein
MSRARPVDGPTISLFPFLAVLLCTMGALLVLLVLFSRSAKEGGQAEAEHQPAHGPEPLPRQLQPDHEQQEGDTQLGQGPDLGGVRNGQPRKPGRGIRQARQPVRAQQHARSEEA